MQNRSSQKRPDPDPNQLAKEIVDQVAESASNEPEKNPAAVALGRLGGKKGGPARAAKLSTEQKREIAQKAARIRWNRSQGDRSG